MDDNFLFPALSSWIAIADNPDQDLTLAKLRQQGFNTVLDSALVVGLAALGFNLYTNFQTGDWLFFSLTLLMYIGLLGIRFGIPRKHHRLRAALFLTSTTMLGLVLSATKATVGDGRIWLLVGPLAAALYLNVQAGFLLLLFNTLSWFGIWALFQADLIAYPLSHLSTLIAADNQSVWVNTGAVFLSAGLVLVISIAFLLNSLDHLLNRSRELANKLQEKERSQLETQQALTSSEQRYQQLVNNSPALIMEISQDNRIISINPAMRQSLALGDTPLAEIHLEYILPSAIYQDRMKKFRTVLEEERILRFEDQHEGRHFETIFVPSQDGRSIQIIAHDITDYKKTQQELLRHQEQLEELVEERTHRLQQEILEREKAERAARAAQKMADIGLLTTGVAHELNSPLQAILSHAEISLRWIENQPLHPPNMLKEKLTIIKEDVLRCASIVRSLQHYAHTSPRPRVEEQLNKLIEDTLQHIQHEFTDHPEISIETRLPAELPPLPCDRDQLQRVLINLLLNARDAIPEQGKITIQAAHHPQRNLFSIEISDTGRGIPGDLQEQIFKPFFTTKEVGEGTGLGLYLASGIIQAHGGEIRFESNPESGTTFTITLPGEPPEYPPPEIKGRYGNSP